MRLLFLFYVVMLGCALSFSSPKKECTLVHDLLADRLAECSIRAEVSSECEDAEFINGDPDECLSA
jgi:hypothetical protein